MRRSDTGYCPAGDDDGIQTIKIIAKLRESPVEVPSEENGN